MRHWFRRFNSLLVLWVVLFSAVAYAVPPAFTWFRPYIVPGLGCIMLGMGLTLVPKDLLRVARRWPAVAFGALLQFGLMPLGAFFVAAFLNLPHELKLGVILVAACPGGTASNVIVYLAGADVALSITMTAVSTLISPLMTPLLLELYASESVQVPFVTQAATIARIIVVPVLAGLGVRIFLERKGRQKMLAGLLDMFPSISVVFIVVIVACIVALNAERMEQFSVTVVVAVALTNGLGLAGGYGLARLCRMDRRTARTVAIEVGMQNSGLGVALATKFFSATTALPSAFFSLWHNLTGPALASYWRGSGATEGS
jgi:BASS family bile acid:Na+ symporter